ncbi:MAG: 50S ribosomal protein L24 [Candidatus Hydrothermarchaeaceae archaeon]
MEKSKQPRKQRKALFKAKLHQKQKLLRSTLSDDLRESYHKRSCGIRKKDKVRVMRGDFKGHEGAVEKVLLKKGTVHVSGATKKKASGTERFYPIHTSNLMIIKLDLKDERRREILER